MRGRLLLLLGRGAAGFVVGEASAFEGTAVNRAICRRRWTERHGRQRQGLLDTPPMFFNYALVGGGQKEEGTYTTCDWGSDSQIVTYHVRRVT
jgi:hypothetical protein